MLKNTFSKKQQTTIKELYDDTHNITTVAKNFSEKFKLLTDYKSIENMRKKISKYLDSEGLTNNKIRLEDTKEFLEASKRKLDKKKYYIITWEQNETPLHTNFWENILTYKEFLDAELSVILGRYKNPTSVFTDKEHENWNKETQLYWDASRHDIHKYLTVLSDVKISPTRKYPLTGIQGLSQGKSIVIGHPKLHLKTEPTLNGYPKKMLMTTGAVTVPNYTDSGAGAISEGVHKLGFVIVEVESKDIFYIRQVEADADGNFVDLCYEVKNQEVNKIDKALGLICGDTHQWQLDQKIDEQNDKICNYFNVDNVVLHDVSDGDSCNNHIIKSPIKQYERVIKGQNLIEKELEDTYLWLKGKIKFNPVVVRSNHDERYDRILDQDWRKDIHNSLFYLDYTSKKLKGEVNIGILPYFLNKKFGNSIRCLDYIDSFKVGKYECSQHGDWGSNGSKGTPASFRNLELPIILAHTHTPYRADDTFYVGTNTHLILDYNQKGMSSWVQANVLVSKNGIAQHLIFVNGKFTTFEFL
ncbi:MAG: hypothetical protein KC414_12300 [Romboutsia sp.]|nr:hypothetical protein [Romboutsia sp.]